MAGDVYVRASNLDSPLWQAGSTLLLIPPLVQTTGGPEPDTVQVDLERDDVTLLTVQRSGRGAKARLFVQFEEVDGRDDAESLVGYRLATDRELFEEPEPGEFWLVEMPGWIVERENGEKVGLVVGTLQTHIDLLEVRPAAGGETFFLPMVSDAVASLDRERRAVVVRPMPGLLPGDEA